MNIMSDFSQSAPHVHTWQTARNSIHLCIATIAPIVVWSALVFGYPVLRIWILSVLAALASDLASTLIQGKRVFSFNASILTGLLVASAMPPGIAWHVPVLASCFAIIVVRQFFGGHGSNWMNPAMAGIAFAYVNWPLFFSDQQLTLSYLERGVFSGLQPVATINAGDTVIRSFSTTGWDRAVSAFLNDALFNRLHSGLPEGFVDTLLGFRATTLGGTGLLFIVIASLVLLSTRIIKATIPLAIVVTFGITLKLLGMEDAHSSAPSLLYALAGNGILLYTLYSATDPVTTPIHRPAMVVFGILVGLLLFVFSQYSVFIEYPAFAIIIANLFVSSFDRAGENFGKWRRSRFV